MTIDITKLDFGVEVIVCTHESYEKVVCFSYRTSFFFYLCESDHLILFASPALPSRVQSSFICTGNDDTPKEQRKSHCAGEIKKRNFEKNEKTSHLKQNKEKKQRDKQKSTELANRL